MSSNIKGLNLFIDDVRQCTNREAERARVAKEVQKIRENFSGKKKLSQSDKKKYMWKLLYTQVLGYEVDFGFEQAIQLIASPKVSEKYSGYVTMCTSSTRLFPNLFCAYASMHSFCDFCDLG